MPVTITTKVETITPEKAAAWLEKNENNRALKTHYVDTYAGAMKRGEWKLNGDPIRFDENGILIDGQHRLWAVVESDSTIESIVVRGLDDDVQETVDNGLRRSLSDALRMRGEKSHVHLAAVLSLKWRYDNNLLRSNDRPTIAQALAVLKKNPRLREAIGQGNRLRSRFRLSQSVASVAWFQFLKLDRDDAELFWDQLISGVDLNEGDPIFVLRRWLELQNTRVTGKASALIQFALIIKAWNAWREGRHIQSLSWRSTAGEAFPTPR